mgnify:CR=1 FL=1
MNKRLIPPIIAAILLAVLVNFTITFMEGYTAQLKKPALAIEAEKTESNRTILAKPAVKILVTVATPSTTVATRSEAFSKTETRGESIERIPPKIYELVPSLLVNIAISLAVALAAFSVFKFKATCAKR